MVKKHLALSQTLVDRAPQSLDYIGLFWTDALWEVTVDGNIPRSKLLVSISQHLMKMDFTNPIPKVKQRIVDMLALGDSWIVQSAVNAKTVLDDLGKHSPKCEQVQRTACGRT